jgi:hypothetical protein
MGSADDSAAASARRVRWCCLAAWCAITLASLPLVAQSPPPCTNPSPLVGPASCDVIVYLVIFRTGTDVPTVTHSLEVKYGFTADKIWQYAVLGFSGHLTAQQVAQLRCEAQVAYVERDLPWCMPFVPCGPDPTPSGPCAAVAANVPLFGQPARVALVLVLAAVALVTAASRN